MMSGLCPDEEVMTVASRRQSIKKIESDQLSHSFGIQYLNTKTLKVENIIMS